MTRAFVVCDPDHDEFNCFQVRTIDGDKLPSNLNETELVHTTSDDMSACQRAFWLDDFDQVVWMHSVDENGNLERSKLDDEYQAFIERL